MDDHYRVLELMEAHNVSLSDVTYQFIITRLARAEALELSLQWLAEMGQHNLTPTIKTISAVIELASSLGHSRLAIDLALNYEQSTPRLLEAQTWYSCLIAAADALYVSTSYIARNAR